MTDENRKSEEILALTTDIVASHVANNTVAIDDLPGLIEQVYDTLLNVEHKGSAKQARPEPAVPIGKSITPDYLICLEDGKKLKMLKRHLKVAYDMTPDDYRERWGLPSDYPMVAPNYAEKRRKLAKQIGLGKKPTKKRSAKK